MTKGRQVYKKISTKENAENAVFFDEVSCYWLTGFHSTDGAVVTARGHVAFCGFALL